MRSLVACLVVAALFALPARATSDPATGPEHAAGGARDGASIGAQPGDSASTRVSAPIIELYTMGQGEVIFEKFGHAAMCVVPSRGPGRCYNYGTTDFDSPPQELGWDFLRGTARFWVSVSSRDAMLGFYRKRDRTVYRQVLDLPRDRARAIAAKLADDALEENRYYIYHHFDDNCTTRLRDILDEALDGALSRGADVPIERTFRSIGQQGLAEQAWAAPIAALLVGRRLDTLPSLWEAMFLPDVLRAEVTERLGATPELVYSRTGRPFVQEASGGIGWLLLVALIVGLPMVLARAIGRWARFGRAWSGALLGLLGTALWLLAIATSVPELRWNEALLVFVPTDFFVAMADEGRARRYARVRLVGLVVISALIAIDVLIQPLEAAVVIAALPMMAIALAPPSDGASTG